MSEKLGLRDGDRIVIIGAAPSGSMFAYSVLRLAAKLNLDLDVRLYDSCDLSQPWIDGCNPCAGVVSQSFYSRLSRIGIDLDSAGGPVCNMLRGYIWSTQSGCLRIESPYISSKIRTVFRGGGSRSPFSGDIVNFDHFLLSKAIAQGAIYNVARVVDLELGSSRRDRLSVHLRSGDRSWTERADLVVGAFGLNRSMLKVFSQLGIGYRPPRMIRAGQMELIRRSSVGRSDDDDYIRIYNLHGTKVRQMILTPKGSFATLTLLGVEDLGPDDLKQVQDTSEWSEICSLGWQWPSSGCCCLPQLVRRSARNFFTDRVVLVGDAACCRYYKNGLESALRSAEFAAEAAVYHGVGRWSFRFWYFSRVWREIIHDNSFGRFLLSLYRWISMNPRLMQWFMESRAALVRPIMVRRHRDLLWDLLTGNRPYRSVFYRMANPSFLGVMLIKWCHVLTIRVKTRISEKFLSFKRKFRFRFGRDAASDRSGIAPPGVRSDSRRRRLISGSRVSIIGGGPAGASCAIMLMRFAKRQGIDLDIVIHEKKDFVSASSRPYRIGDSSFVKGVNQCSGVLSPPIYEIMTEQLGIEFPDYLVQKHIIGYHLHGSHRTISLDEPYGSSYAVRRVMFDNYMTEQALAHGCRLNIAKVTDIVRIGERFGITTSSGNYDADVIVGAFGVDLEVADIFTRRFGYRRPEYMQAIITKMHPDKDFLRSFGLRIHAYLPAIRRVEFGAVTPKFNHLAINIAGRRLDLNTMLEFISSPQVSRILPRDYSERGREIFYEGCFPTSPAGRFFADRMVLIGDASGMIRPFKGKGINSAILSGIAAAGVMVHRGLGVEEFRRYYYPVFRPITEDLWYARSARCMTNILAHSGKMDIVLGLAEQSPPLRRALTEAVSGSCTYKTILNHLSSDRILWRSGALLLRQAASRL